MSHEIIQALDGIEAKQREITDRLLAVEQKSGARPDGMQTKEDTIGAQFVKSFEANKDLFAKTRSVRLEIKAAGDPVTTASGRHLISGGVGVSGLISLGFQNAMKIRPVPGTSAVEYSRYTGVTGAAAVQSAEGVAKAALRPEHSLIIQPAITIAGYTKMSRQALGDSAELASAVNVTLNDSVNRALDDVLTGGSVSPAFAGFNALATAHTSALFTELVDALAEGISDMQLGGFNPDVLVIAPSTWMLITTDKGTDGHYLTGTYLQATPKEFLGLRVVISTGVPASKGMLLDSRHSELLISDAFSIEVAYSGDDFTKNLVTVLGEARVIPTFRTVGTARLITPKP